MITVPSGLSKFPCSFSKIKKKMTGLCDKRNCHILVSIKKLIFQQFVCWNTWLAAGNNRQHSLVLFLYKQQFFISQKHAFNRFFLHIACVWIGFFESNLSETDNKQYPGCTYTHGPLSSTFLLSCEITNTQTEKERRFHHFNFLPPCIDCFWFPAGATQFVMY